MNRQEFRVLALERIEDAKVLLDAKRYSAAHYIAGYAVECALKACIAGKTREDDFPPKDANRYYTHSIEQLLKYADLDVEYDQRKRLDADFEANGKLAADWKEEARYQTMDQRKAEELLRAITDDQHGLLRWLEGYW